MCNLSLKIPAWLKDFSFDEEYYPDPESRVRLTILLAMENIIRKTGGPFSAVVFSRTDWKPVSLGVNLVTYTSKSVAHAEIVALTYAQELYGSYDLKDYDCELVSSCEPCAMCYGALLWSGLKGLVFGASGKDAEQIGFDEGEKPVSWRSACKSRNIYVEGPVLRDEAKKVFDYYIKNKGIIYNAGNQDGVP